MVAYSNLAVTEYELETVESPYGAVPLRSSFHHQRQSWPTILQPRLFWKETVDDLKRTAWKRCGGILFWSLFLGIWFAGLVFCIALLVVSVAPGWAVQNVNDLCGPDGQFRLSPRPYNYLQTATAFDINLGWGKFSFGDAKLIDVTWDIIIGRGGQGLLGLVTYFCFTRALTRIMETTTISHADFQAVTIHHASVQSVWIQLHGLFKLETVRARLLILWMILSGLFVLSVPTFASAMTGYSITVQPFIAPTNASLLSAEEFDVLLYTIHDGSRLGSGFGDNYQVFSPEPMDQFALFIKDEGTIFQCAYCRFYPPNRNTWESQQDQQDRQRNESSVECRVACEVSRYVEQYGFLGRNHSQSVFVFSNIDNTSINLDGPSLNISAHIPSRTLKITDRDYETSIKLAEGYSPTSRPYGVAWVDPETGQRPFLNNPNTLLKSLTTNLSLSLDQFKDKGICTASTAGDLTYKWGFSALLTFCFLCFLLVWTIGMFAVHADTFINSKLDANGRVLGTTRAIFDLHAAMSKRLEDKDSDLLSENALRALVRGVRMDYQLMTLQSDLVRKSRRVSLRRWWGRFRFKSWAWKEKKWLAMLLLSSVLLVQSTLPPWGPSQSCSVTWIPLIATSTVLALGKQRRSRWIPFWVMMLLFIILISMLASTTSSY